MNFHNLWQVYCLNSTYWKVGQRYLDPWLRRQYRWGTWPLVSWRSPGWLCAPEVCGLRADTHTNTGCCGCLLPHLPDNKHHSCVTLSPPMSNIPDRGTLAKSATVRNFRQLRNCYPAVKVYEIIVNTLSHIHFETFKCCFPWNFISVAYLVVQ